MVVTGVSEDLPLFGRIEQIICVEKEMFFYLQPIKTNGFDEHVNAFSVQADVISRKILVQWNNLITHEAVQEITFEDEAYIILRRSIQSSME